VGQSADHPGRYRHGLLIALALSGCGRVSFDASGDSGNDAGADAFVCTTSVGHDEDGDGIDDGCDLCPLDPSSANGDTDSDGIGDLCDPEPSNNRQRLLLFESFVSRDARWTTDDGYITDAARLGIAGGNLYLSVPINDVDVYVRAVVNTVHPTNQNHFYVAVERTDTTQWYSEILEDPGGTERRFSLMYYNGAFDQHANQNLATAFAPGPLYMKLSVRTATRMVTGTAELGVLSPMATGTYTLDISDGDLLHLFCGGMQIDVTAVMLVETQ
jgi:hypothetical protein